jgi:hypothetical protein
MVYKLIGWNIWAYFRVFSYCSRKQTVIYSDDETTDKKPNGGT